MYNLAVDMLPLMGEYDSLVCLVLSLHLVVMVNV